MIVRILNIIRIVSNQACIKSATMVGLFLMTLLVMLSTVAAIPISNVNLFSNAMASEKNSDKNDNTQKYESYYSDNNDKYRANYEDKYYYQQQDQTQPRYSNNYGYDNGYNDKKISYNNSYEDIKKDSTYPTKDNKIACQTGQFEGFFVESVEFCKLKVAQGPQLARSARSSWANWSNRSNRSPGNYTTCKWYKCLPSYKHHFNNKCISC